jgi:hypothetical protein
MSSKIAIGVLRLGVASLLGIAASTSVLAQSMTPAQGLLNDTLVVNLGAFVLGTDMKGNLNGQSTTNPEVDFSGTFGKGDDATRGRMDVLWRINPRHHLRFMYFNNESTRSKVLQQNVSWGDSVYQVGASLESVTKFSVSELAYEYAFMREPTYEVAGSFGVHYVDLSVQLSGMASVNGAPVAQFSTITSSVPAPLPVIGLRAGWAVSPNWYLDAQGQLFSFKAQGYDGHWSDLRAGATWMFSRHFGVGMGYNYFGAVVDVDKPSFNGRLSMGYSGLLAYLTGSF